MDRRRGGQYGASFKLRNMVRRNVGCATIRAGATVKFLGRVDFRDLVIDRVECVPPGRKQPRHVLIGWQRTNTTAFPVAVLTMHGPIIEMIEVNDIYRRQGYGMAMIAYECQRLGRPLVAMASSEDGEALVRQATAQGWLAPSREEDDEYFDD